MCKVEKETIERVNKRLISRIDLKKITTGKVHENQIIVPVNVLGRINYRMSLEKVNEIYSRARSIAISNTMRDGEKIG